MIPEIGQFALVLALLLAVAQAFLPLAGTTFGKPAWAATARPVAVGQFLFVLLAWAALATSFVNNDFSVANVAQHSNLSPAHPLPVRRAPGARTRARCSSGPSCSAGGRPPWRSCRATCRSASPRA